MKKLLLLVAVCLVAFPALAQDAKFKLSLWDEMSFTLPKNKIDISGLDLGIGSTTDYLKGLQLDAVWAETNYEMRGASISWAVSKARQAWGAQLSPVNMAEEISGAQVGAINMTSEKVTGTQIGFFNNAENLHGFQVGLVNHAKNIYGVQVGLINIAENGILPVMIFVNGRFDSSFNI